MCYRYTIPACMLFFSFARPLYLSLPGSIRFGRRGSPFKPFAACAPQLRSRISFSLPRSLSVAEGGHFRSSLSPLALRADAAAGFRSPASENDPPDRFLHEASSLSEILSIDMGVKFTPISMERETGLEPATSALARLRSTK